MPANLTPQYLAAEQRFKEAVTPQEKIHCLEEMMATIPKHKGTEKMRADLKRRMAKLRDEAQRKSRTSSRASALYSVHREGAGQVVLAGAPNSGKSSLLARLTHASPEIGDYPYTTRLPQPGMMPFENIQVQIVDMPPITERSYEPWIGGILRGADVALLVVDVASPDVLDETDEVLRVLEGSRLRLAGPGTSPPDAEEGSVASRPTLLVANKCDGDNAADDLPILREFFESRFPILPVSAVTGEGIEELRMAVFEALDVVRIFTKIPGKKPDTESPPFVLKRGRTILDLARAVHRDLAHTLQFARLWSSAKGTGRSIHDGQMVDRTHVLEDEDIVELHG